MESYTSEVVLHDWIMSEMNDSDIILWTLTEETRWLGAGTQATKLRFIPGRDLNIAEANPWI